MIVESSHEIGHKPGNLLSHRSVPVAWACWVLVITSALISLILRTQNTAPLMKTIANQQLLYELLNWAILNPLTVPMYATVGAIIATRRPTNAVGWLCLVLGLLTGMQDVAWQYATRALEVAPGSLPVGPQLALVATELGFIQFPLPHILLLLLFPTGRFLSTLWRVVGWIAVLINLTVIVVSLFAPVLYVGEHTRIANPLRIEALSGITDAVSNIGLILIILCLLLAVISLVFRWRQAKEEERQQLKWLVYVGIVTIAAVLLGMGLSNLRLPPDMQPQGYLSIIVSAVGTAGQSIGIPLAIGVAMLRYRLYDIDVLINRTMVYVSLSALLIGIYVGCVFVLQHLLSGFIQQPSGLVTAGSTLLIAALFQPFRSRIQKIIDLRFYRRKYDAAQALANFGVAVNAQVDLAQLRTHLLSVVEETMQPVHLSLWLPPSQSLPSSKEIH